MKNFTHVNHGFVFEELEAVTTEDGRYYIVPSILNEGGTEKYESVTTVLNYDKREFFEEWRKTPGNKAYSEWALFRGNEIHESIEDYINNIPDAFINDNKEIQGLLRIMESNLDKIDNVYGVEVPLYSHNLELAGRVDCVAEFNGKLSIIDFKGSSKIKKEEHIENYFLQATTYAIMWEERTGQRIDNIVIIMGNEQGFCQVFEKRVEEFIPRLFRKLCSYDDKYKKETYL